VDTGFPTSYITFIGDYDSLQNNGLLEKTRAAIYNLLRNMNVPISSNLIVTKGNIRRVRTNGKAVWSNLFVCLGSVIGSFIVNGQSGANLASAVTALTTTSASAVNGLQVSSVTINGRSYNAASSASSGSSGSQSSGQAQNNTGLIVGLVVGLVGAAVIAVLAVLSYKKYQTKKRERTLFNQPDVEHTTTAPSRSMDDNYDLGTAAFIAPASQPKIDRSQLHSPLPMLINEPRAPSATFSISMVDQLNAHKKPAVSAPMPEVELIKFD
jgi:hypothetical protein